MIPTVIIDDSKKAIESLKEMVLIYLPQIEILGVADDISSGINIINKYNPELIFLDIELKDQTGFDLLSFFPNTNFKTIFITAYEHYAIEAFNHRALHYVLKPVDPQTLVEAVTRLYQETPCIEKNAHPYNMATTLRQPDKKVAINTAKETKYISLSKVRYVHAEGRYSFIHIEDNKTIIVSKLIKDIERFFDHSDFFRVSKSFLVNLNHVQSLKHIDGGVIEMSDGVHITIPRRKRDDFSIKMSQYLS